MTGAPVRLFGSIVPPLVLTVLDRWGQEILPCRAIASELVVDVNTIDSTRFAEKQQM